MGSQNLSRKSWLTYSDNTDFPLTNIPFGVVSVKGEKKQLATRIGDTVILLEPLRKAGLLNEITQSDIFVNDYLNSFMALGKSVTNTVRTKLIELFTEGNSTISSNDALVKESFAELKDVICHLPVKVGDYTDFYSSRQHATNVGIMFRDPANALLPNWLHIPVGYHGRASSIVESGVPFYRPKGQRKGPNDPAPVYGPSTQLDIELEVGFIIGKPTQMGDTVTTDKADEYIFGFVLFNDWSARDIQSWEYVPLGPFLGKNFCSSISPWVVTMEALEPFKVPGELQDPKVLPYLEFNGNKNIDIKLEVYLTPENEEENLICSSNYKYMYWNYSQQLAHHTVNGCNLNVGDIMASGTISGTEENSFGSMLELTWRGTKPLKLKDGSERKFLNDHDTITIKGYAEKEGYRIGLGEVKTKILPAK